MTTFDLVKLVVAFLLLLVIVIWEGRQYWVRWRIRKAMEANLEELGKRLEKTREEVSRHGTKGQGTGDD